MPHLTTPAGVTWHYDVEGEGNNILFLHGWGASSRIWRQQTKYFSQSYRVCSIDLPGHGKSSWRPMTLDEMAEDIAGILKHAGFQQTTIVASSLGGLVALKIFRRGSPQVQRLVFVGSQPKFQRSEDYPFGLEARRIAKLAGQLATDYPAMVHIFFRSLFTPHERRTRRYRWIQTFRNSEEVPGKEALLSALNILAEEDLRPELFSVDIPVQFINGTEDYICLHATFDYIRRNLPHARFDWFENCGHYPFLCYPDEFNQRVETFLRETAFHGTATGAKHAVEAD